MKLPTLAVKLPDLPKPVAVAAAVIAASLVLFGILLPVLGGAADDAVIANGRLTNDIAQATKDLKEASDDYRYVTDNLAKFEALLQSDRLVPHTRRAAVRQMTTLAVQHGLTTLNYDFVMAGDKSLAAVTSQVQAKSTNSQEIAYRVNVESVDLKLGAPLDGLIYSFLVDLSRDFPGAAVIQSITLERAPKVTDEILQLLAQGQDAGLVKGDVKILWRTAQAIEPAKAAR